jgi:hypothetical protein
MKTRCDKRDDFNIPNVVHYQMEKGKLKNVTQRKHKEKRLNNKNSSENWW